MQRAQSRMVHCSIVGCNNKQASNSEVIYFNLSKDRQKSWLTAISRDKGNLPSNVFVCSNHFEDKYFDKSWDLQNRLFCTDRPTKMIWTAIPTLLSLNQISTPRKAPEIKAKQKEKEEVKLWNRVWTSQI